MPDQAAQPSAPDKKVWDFIELVARGNTEMVQLEKLASNLIEEKYESEQTSPDQCTCEYISPGAAALHAVFHGVRGPLPKVPKSSCPLHGEAAQTSAHTPPEGVIGKETMNCNHPQCCICLKRECQQSMFERRFMSFGGLFVCSESCIRTAISIAYEAACRLGCPEDKPCGRTTKDSAAALSESATEASA